MVSFVKSKAQRGKMCCFFFFNEAGSSSSKNEKKGNILEAKLGAKQCIGKSKKKVEET